MQPLTESKAWTYALLNVAATPGLGTLLARRFVSGVSQLSIALAGCVLFLGWFVQKLRLLYGQISGTSLPVNAGDQLGKWGVVLFLVAWVWALISSIQLIIAARKAPPQLSIPPRIVNAISEQNR